MRMLPDAFGKCVSQIAPFAAWPRGKAQERVDHKWERARDNAHAGWGAERGATMRAPDLHSCRPTQGAEGGKGVGHAWKRAGVTMRMPELGQRSDTTECPICRSSSSLPPPAPAPAPPLACGRGVDSVSWLHSALGWRGYAHQNTS